LIRAWEEERGSGKKGERPGGWGKKDKVSAPMNNSSDAIKIGVGKRGRGKFRNGKEEGGGNCGTSWECFTHSQVACDPARRESKLEEGRSGRVDEPSGLFSHKIEGIGGRAGGLTHLNSSITLGGRSSRGLCGT